ncbi:phosphoglycerate mutase-like protein [Penicillium pulvis]|uniref:phosphoglycerate mutase-like protein n=1 Tax=Penicillium pulvis TaxID=1562058 RepID=UPI0025467739|nr:phosphoglycerate mutase-like protein [Penicillium pulvis]KAJ5798954.1 phosphoglycerate mutase-like protein [Penicillium pulvis]
MAKIIHIIRHAEGFHQLPRDHPNALVRDPSLTPKGIVQSRQFNQRFSYHACTDLLCASPLRRTIQTTNLAFEPEIRKGLKILALADAQESSDAPCDTGSDVFKLVSEFGTTLDVSLLRERWYEKKSLNNTSVEALRARAIRLRRLLRERPEKNIVLVSHGTFAHYITEHVDPQGHQTGEYWRNVMWRTYSFSSGDDGDAKLLETDESINRHTDN